jgi:OPA family glycerol-6-phosphate transporter-like MFS transporter 4
MTTEPQWYSRERFGLFWSGLAASSNVALALAPYIVLSATEQFGWRLHLLVSAGVCAIAAAFAAALLIDDPTSIGSTSYAQETCKASASKATKQDGADQKQRLTDLLRSPFLWIISLSYFAVFLAKSCAGDWANFYLHEELGLTSFQGKRFSLGPFFC